MTSLPSVLEETGTTTSPLDTSTSTTSSGSSVLDTLGDNVEDRIIRDLSLSALKDFRSDFQVRYLPQLQEISLDENSSIFNESDDTHLSLVAVCSGNDRLLELFNTNFHGIDYGHGLRPAHIAAGLSNGLNTLKKLHAIDPRLIHYRDDEGVHPAVVASSRSHTDIVNHYLNATNFDPLEEDCNGLNFYHHAAQCASIASLKFLLRNERETRNFLVTSEGTPKPLEIALYCNTDERGEVDHQVVKLFKQSKYKQETMQLVSSNGAYIPTYTLSESFRSSIVKNTILSQN